jgi:hypothetical protein
LPVYFFQVEFVTSARNPLVISGERRIVKEMNRNHGGHCLRMVVICGDERRADKMSRSSEAGQ